LPRVLDWSQVELAITGETRPRERAILSLLACGGLRRGEVVGLRVGDFGAQALAKDLAPWATPRSDAALFVTAAGRPITYRAVTRTVRRAARRLGSHVHRTCFPRARRRHPGHSRSAGSRVGGDHRDYTHVSAARRRRIVQLLEAPGDIRSAAVSPA
jgi:site-specific recombinase XerC